MVATSTTLVTLPHQVSFNQYKTMACSTLEGTSFVSFEVMDLSDMHDAYNSSKSTPKLYSSPLCLSGSFTWHVVA